MKRRGFLGLMGGAVVAGPSAATRAVAELPKGLGLTAGPMPTPTPMSQKASLAGDWRRDRIGSLKRLIGGDLSDEEKEGRRRLRLVHLQKQAEVRVAGLISMSDTAKIRMAQREVQNLDDERDKSYWADELNRLLKGE